MNLFKNETMYNFFNYFKEFIIKNVSNITKKNFNYIYPNINLYNQLYLNITTKYKSTLNNLDCLYLLNVDHNFKNLIKNINMDKTYIIYQGHHYNDFIKNANMILPVKPYLQEKGSFINLEGEILKIKEVVYDDNIYVKDNILTLYSIFSVLFEKLRDSFKEIIYNKNILNDNPALNLTNTYTIKDNLKLFNNIKIKNNILKNYTINSTLYNFYNNDNISMSSQIMSNCNKTLVKKSNY